ncbi:MAG: flagellar filament capping protein FliD [Planctomycetota bacterium]
MGQITTGTGLVSGLDIQGIVSQLIAIEARPRDLVQNRNEVLQSQQVAFQDLNAQLLSLKNSTDNLTNASSFAGTTASSSDESIVSVSSGTGATPGTYSFIVNRLVASQQTITRGFQDEASTPLSATATTLSFDRGEARLDSETRVTQLNGGAGLNRGYIRITDRSGATGLVDLTSVVSVDDVINQINSTTGVNVIAQVDGDRLTLTDASGGTGELSVADVGLNGTATSLGLLGAASLDGDGDDAVLTGAIVNRVGDDTLLATLNDGKGVRTAGGSDLTITTGGGATYVVDLSDKLTLGDVFDAIDTATGGEVVAQATTDGSGIQLVDTTGGGTGFTINSGNGSNALSDLGLVAGTADDDADGLIGGERILASINSKLLKSLLGGNGIGGITGDGQVPVDSSTLIADILQGAGPSANAGTNYDFRIFDRNGAEYRINVNSLTTLGDLTSAINTTTGGDVTASLVDRKLVLTDNTGGTGNLVVENGIGGATTATALGIEIDAATDSVTGIDLDPQGTPAVGASIQLTNSAGGGGTVDISGSRSASDILDAINTAALGVTATLNRAGNGILLTDTAGGTGDLVVADTVGNTAAQLGLTGTFTDGLADTGDLEYAYVNGGTRLDDLGIERGRFDIRDSSGATYNIDLTQGNETTIQDVIDEINSKNPATLLARINDTGDGIYIEDLGPGVTAIEITEDGSTTARDLGILGTAANAGDDVDGSFETTISVTTADTLTTLRNKINDADIGIAASIINDGSPGAPFRLSLSSEKAGTDGAFVLDDGLLDLRATTLSQAQDAVVFYGGNDPATSVVVESKSNTLSSVIPGADISLLNISDQPVRVTIGLDDASIVDNASSLVTAFNSVIDTINKYDSYNAETEERGLLLGDSTVARVRSSLYNAVINPNRELTGQFTSLAQIGIRVGTGAKLEFDQDKFQEALQTDRDAVEALLTLEQFELDPDTGEETETIAAQGVGVELQKLMDRLTDDIDGVVQGQLDVLSEQVRQNEQRIEELNERLDSKRERLEAEFLAMEQALARLQDQSSALTQLSSISTSSAQ